MTTFDFDAARKAGYSDEEIQQHLLASQGAQDAKKAGYSDQEILGHFGISNPTPAPTQSPPASSGVLDEAGRLAGIAGGGLAQGVAAGLAMPSTLGRLVDRGVNAGAGLLGLNPASQQDIDATRYSGPIGALNSTIQPPSIEATEGLVNRMGAAGPEPQGIGENLLSAGSKGVGAILVPGGGGLSVPNAIVGAASGIGSEIGSELMPDSSVAPIVGGLIGGGAVGAAQSAMKGIGLKAATTAAEQGVTDAKGTMQAGQDALTDLNQQSRQMGIDKKQMMLDHQEQLDAANAAHAAQVEQLSTQSTADVAQQTGAARTAVTNVAQAMGPSETLQQTGTNLQSAAQGWMDNTFPARKTAIWAPVDAQIPGDTPVNLQAFRGALGDINSSAGSMEPLAELMKPSLPRQLAQRLTAVTEGQEEGIAPATTWDDVRQLRTTLGDAMTNPKLINDVGGQNLAHMYATLSEDLRSAARSVSPEAEQAFNGANATTTQLFDVARGPMSSILNAKDPESAANAVINSGKKGATAVATLRQELPDAVNDLGGTALKLGKWDGLSPEMKQQLVPDPATRQTLDTSHQTINEAQQNAQTQLEAGIDASQQQVDALKQTHRTARQTQTEQEIELDKQKAAQQASLDAAKVSNRTAEGVLTDAQKAQADQSAKWSMFGKTSVIGGGLLTGEILANLGGRLGETVGNPLGFQGAGALGTGLALGLPAAAMILRNPDIRVPAIAGALRGNALAPVMPPQKNK